MHLKRFTNPQDFYDHIAPALSNHEAENNLIFGISQDIINGMYDPLEAYMACVEHEGVVLLAALRTPPNRLLLSYADVDVIETQGMDALVRDVRSTYGTDLTGVQGPSHIVKQFLEDWQDRTGQEYKLGMAQHIYKLTEVKPPQGVAGSLRYATDADFAGPVLEWITAFNTEAIGTQPDPERMRRWVARHQGADRATRGVMLWVVDDEPVSMAAYMGPTPNGFRVGGVYTPPELRRRGYASACTAAVSQNILEMGRQFAFLFTDATNPTSNHIYQEIGYEYVCDTDEYRLLPIEETA